VKPPLFAAVDCLSLPVGDLDEALRFYQQELGHALIWRDSHAAGLGLPSSDAELVLRVDERPMETDLRVDSVPEAIERFCRAGGSVVAGPFPIRIGLCAVVEDPWGNRLVILDASSGLLRTDSEKRVIGNEAPDGGGEASGVSGVECHDESEGSCGRRGA